MYIKKFRKKCDVRGCKNVSDVFIISRRSETGNSVAICKECLQDAIKSIDGYAEEIKKPKPKTSLFPHPERVVKEEVAISSVADDTTPNPTEVIDDVTEDNLIDSVTEDTVTDDFFGAVKEEPIAKPNVPTKPKTTAKKPNKASKKKK